MARSFLHYLVTEFRTGCSVLVVISFEFRRVNFLYQSSVDLSHYLLAMQLIVPGYIIYLAFIRADGRFVCRLGHVLVACMSDDRGPTTRYA